MHLKTTPLLIKNILESVEFIFRCEAKILMHEALNKT